MSLPAARRKHCDQAHPYQQKLKDGISLLGRKTPGLILQEVKRRQAEDRGTASHWAKLAAEYGPRHANFITKHNMRLPTSRNDRNSWGHISQSFAHTRGRPASAPALRTASARAKPEGTRGVGSHRVQSARRSVQHGDDSSGTDGPPTLFARTKEIEAVVKIMQDTEKSHWVPKAKKGQRRKVAEAAAKATATVRSKNAHSGLRQRPRSALGVNSDTGRRTTIQPGGGRRRARPNTAKYIINNVRPQPAVSGRRENASLGGSADEKLGMTARTRIYSFTGEMGSGHQNGMLRAMHAAAGDAHRRRRPSTAGAARRPDFDGRGVDDEKKTAAWVSERSDPDTSGRPLSARETAGTDNMDTQKHLGVVDISKLTTILSHAQVRGYCHAGGNHRGYNQSDRSGPGFNGLGRTTPVRVRNHPNGGTRTEGIILSTPNQAWQHAPQETEGVVRNGGRSKDVARSMGLRAGGALAKGSIKGSMWHTRDDCAGPEQCSTGGSAPPSAPGSDAGGDGGLGPEAGDKSESFDAAGVAGVGMTRQRSEGTMPQRDCLRGRYAKAECKSKGSYAAKKTASTITESRFTHMQSPTLSSPYGTRYHSSGCAGSSNESSHISFEPSCREGRGFKGTNKAAEATSWQERLESVQRRRGVLEEAMGAAKKRLVNRRALIETRNSSGAKGSTGEQVGVPPSVRGAARVVGLNDARKHRKRPHRQWKRVREPSRRHVAAASRIQRAFRCFLQHRLWLGDKCDREFVSLVASEDDGGECDISDPPGARSSSWEGDPTSEVQRVPRLVDGTSYRTKRTHQRHLAVRAMRLLRGYIHCTQARVLLLQLLWERVEGDILGERRSHRAAVETRAAVAIQPIAHIRRLAVGLIKLQKSAKMYQMECQAKQAKQGKQAKKVNSPNKFKAKKGGGHAEGGFETAKQARSEKDECEAMLREHGRRGRRLVEVSVRNRFLVDLLHSYRRQHVIRDEKEYLMESSRPPMVDSADVKRMLACPTEEMHMFSDPKNYRTRSRHTRLALPFREVEGLIQDTIGSHMRSTFRSKVQEALGTDLASTNPEPHTELGIPSTTTTAKISGSTPLATDRTSIADKLQRQEAAERVGSANESYSATASGLQPVSEARGPGVENQAPPAATSGGDMRHGRRTVAVVQHRKAASPMGLMGGNASS